VDEAPGRQGATRAHTDVCNRGATQPGRDGSARPKRGGNSDRKALGHQKPGHRRWQGPGVIRATGSALTELFHPQHLIDPAPQTARTRARSPAVTAAGCRNVGDRDGLPPSDSRTHVWPWNLGGGGAQIDRIGNCAAAKQAVVLIGLLPNTEQYRPRAQRSCTRFLLATATAFVMPAILKWAPTAQAGRIIVGDAQLTGKIRSPAADRSVSQHGAVVIASRRNGLCHIQGGHSSRVRRAGSQRGEVVDVPPVSDGASRRRIPHRCSAYRCKDVKEGDRTPDGA